MAGKSALFDLCSVTTGQSTVSCRPWAIAAAFIWMGYRPWQHCPHRGRSNRPFLFIQFVDRAL